jgi:large subunit ribosomal protein L5
MARLRDIYKSEIVPSLMSELGLKNVHQIPKLEKITLNMGIGKALQDANLLNALVKDMTKIAGQKAVITKAKKSVSNFKLREGYSIGCMVTLRNERMYEFLDRLINFAIPSIRDFRGVSSKSFDGRGNYSMGLAEHVVFPELEADKTDHIHGMDITIVTSAKSNEHAYKLLEKFGMPFRK